MKKSIIALTLALTMMGGMLVGCSSTSSSTSSTSSSTSSSSSSSASTATTETASVESVVLKLGHNQAEDSEFHLGALYLQELVAEKSGGTLTIDVYANAALGDEAELTEGTKMGTVDMALVATGNVATYEPMMSVFDLPFLFRDYDHVDLVLEGEIGQQLSDMVAEKGIQILSYWESGFRHFLNNVRPIAVPEDMAGLKMRTPAFPTLIAAVEEMGASAYSLAFSELYMACQQGVVDGQEGPLFALRSAKMYEVQKYLTLDGHTYAAMAMIINPAKFASLSEEHQQILTESAIEAGIFEKDLIRANEADTLEYLKTEGGLEVIEEVDKELWSAATAQVYVDFEDQFDQAIIQAIKDAE